MKRKSIIYALLAIFLTFVVGNKICIDALQKNDALTFSKTFSKQQASQNTGKSWNSSKIDSTSPSFDSTDEDFSQFGKADALLTFKIITGIVLFLGLLFRTKEKKRFVQFSPFTISVKKFILIRTLRI